MTSPALDRDLPQQDLHSPSQGAVHVEAALWHRPKHSCFFYFTFTYLTNRYIWSKYNYYSHLLSEETDEALQPAGGSQDCTQAAWLRPWALCTVKLCFQIRGTWRGSHMRHVAQSFFKNMNSSLAFWTPLLCSVRVTL